MEIATFGEFCAPQLIAIAPLFWQIPYAKEQRIFWTNQGILSSEQGISGKDQERHRQSPLPIATCCTPDVSFGAPLGLWISKSPRLSCQHSEAFRPANQCSGRHLRPRSRSERDLM